MEDAGGGRVSFHDKGIHVLALSDVSQQSRNTMRAGF